MRTIFRFIGRRILSSKYKKFRLLSQLVTIFGILRLATRAATPVRRIVLTRDEAMQIRITKTGNDPS